jgi:hypothetical protein
MSHDGKKVEVDHIESNIDLSSVEDVEYFLDKILRNSSLPKGYLVGEDTITTAQTLEAQDLKLRRTLIPLKQALLTGILNLVENVLTHAGYDVSKLEVEVGLNEPIQIPADILQKYSDIADLLKSFLELNAEMPDVNKFQFLIKLGMPTDLASLICSKVSINTLPNGEDLGKFLIGQKIRQPGMVQDNPELEEQVTYSVTSREFLNQRADLKRLLVEFVNTKRTTLDRSLKESLLKSSATKIEVDDE